MNSIAQRVALIACNSVLAVGVISCGSPRATSSRVIPTQTPLIIRQTTVVTRVVTRIVTATPAQVAVASTAEPEMTVTVEPGSTPSSEPTQPAEATAVPEVTSTSEAPTSPASANFGQINHGGNMRDTPEGNVLGQVCPGDKAAYIQSQGVWYQIRIEQTAADCVPERAKAGSVGWVHQSLLDAPSVAIPTTTPAPTATQGPTATPVPTAEISEPNQTQKIGPIRDTLRDESFSVEMTLQKVRWVEKGDYAEPKTGKIFVVVSVRIKNFGPSPLRSIGPRSFEVLDANGVLTDDYTLITGVTDDCGLDFVDLIADGSMEGCVAYEVPLQGRVQLIYAPYQYEGLKPGRYLSFDLRP